jgi:hypothetical protein
MSEKYRFGEVRKLVRRGVLSSKTKKETAILKAKAASGSSLNPPPITSKQGA